ncbi:MAG: PIN domain-containing protein [Desulfosalsimonadaceae bacterium]|nr:PIN domain-containing protein [Desulfosalsimonadaceae bacterium]
MKKILVDSGPLIALFDASDKHPLTAVSFIKNNPFPLITTLASITETLHMLDFNRNAQIDFLGWVSRGAVEIHPIGNVDFSRIGELTKTYQDLPMDFANACLVFLAEKHKMYDIATIDRDFTIYRINGKMRFNIVLP